MTRWKIREHDPDQMTLRIPAELQARMAALPGTVDWSAIAAKAFEQVLETHEDAMKALERLQQQLGSQ